MRLSALAFAAFAPLTTLVAACDDPYVPPPPPQGARACDPVATGAPTTLATVLSAGAAKDGSLYVVDKTPPKGVGVAGERRVFIGAGTALERKKVTSVSETEEALTLGLNADPPDFFIKIEHTGFDGPVTRMGIFRGGLSAATTFNLDVEGDALTPVADLSTFTIAPAPSADVFYAASTSDGRQLVVLQPLVDFTIDKLRVFLGTKDRMVERTLAPSGVIITSFTSLVFDVDGVKTTAALTFPSSGAESGGARLEQDNRTIATLTPLPGSPGDKSMPTKSPASTFTTGLSFLCF